MTVVDTAPKARAGTRLQAASYRPARSLVAKAARIEALLTEAYGPRVWRRENYSNDLVGALVATILSQNTSDINSGRAFATLRERFAGDWEAVRLAPTDRIVDAIRAGGLAQIKAPRIQTVLDAVHAEQGVTSLDWLRDWDDDRIRTYLRSLPGVGAKTAACVLMFNLGRPVLPVDTHVHRVAARLGLIGERTTADKAHDELQSLVRPEHIYSFHVHLIEHGRRLCHARNPECAICPVNAECVWYRIGKESIAAKANKRKERPS
jgi:endonuclease-3